MVTTRWDWVGEDLHVHGAHWLCQLNQLGASLAWESSAGVCVVRRRHYHLAAGGRWAVGGKEEADGAQGGCVGALLGSDAPSRPSWERSVARPFKASSI